MIALLRHFIRPYRTWLVIVIALLSLQAFATLFLPTLNASLINTGVVEGDIGYILRIGGLMVGLTVILGVCSVTAVYFSAKIAMGVGRDIRHDIFHSVQGFSLTEVDRIGAPSLITRNTNDVQQVQMLVLSALTMMFLAPITAVGGVILAVHLNVRLSGLLIVIIPLMGVSIGLLMWKAIPLFRSMQKKIDNVNEILRENLTGIRVIRAFGRTDYEEQRFDVGNADLTDTALRVARLFALMMPTLMLIMNLSSVAVLWFGAGLVGDGEMQIGDLTAYLQYITQILFAVMMAVMLFVMIPRAAASSERIQEVLTTRPQFASDLMTTEQTQDSPPLHDPRIEFVDVGFRYPGAEDAVLSDISFQAGTGVTAIVGGTGSGKTTLVNLIPRLHDVSAGAIRIQGVDIRDWPLLDLRTSMAVVPQRSFLFSGTIASNLRIGRPEATEQEMWEALTIAQASGFVSELPEQLDAPVDQGGSNFSGGQKQRLAIARAIIRQAPILLLDDSFSALDFLTDAKLRSELRERVADTAMIIVAQRISTIMHADQIIVLDAGRIVGRGTHSELLDSCPTYAEIVESQLVMSDYE